MIESYILVTSNLPTVPLLQALDSSSSLLGKQIAVSRVCVKNISQFHVELIKKRVKNLDENEKKK